MKPIAQMIGFGTIILLWLLLALAGCGGPAAPAPGAGATAVVVAVVDGDTIDVLLFGRSQRVG
jgi:hypothetical protein